MCRKRGNDVAPSAQMMYRERDNEDGSFYEPSEELKKKTVCGCKPSEDERLRSLVLDLNNYIIILN